MSKLGNKTIGIYLSVPQCACGWPLSDLSKWHHRISKYCFSKHYVNYVRSAWGNYLLKPHKLNKENVIITFQNYVRIMLGSYVRLALGSYVIKACKWDKKNTQ